MTEKRDPQLEALFDAARTELAHDPFINKVMADIERRKRRVMLGWFVAAIALTPFIWLLGGPIIDAVNLVSDVLPVSLVDLNNQWLRQLLAPINSIAGVIAITLIFGLKLYRRISA